MEFVFLILVIGLLFVMMYAASSVEPPKNHCKMHKWEYKDQGMTCSICGLIPKIETRDDNKPY